MPADVESGDPAGPPGERARLATRLGLVGTALCLVGLGLSAYLTYEHYSATPSFACPETGVVNCVKVTTSRYAEVAGVPVALLGLVYFVVLAPLQLPAAWRRPERSVRVARALGVASGTVMVLWLVYVELFRVDAICLYCTGVHVVVVGLVALTAFGTALLGPSPGTEG